MLKYGKRLIVAAGVIATAGTVALSGLTAASASPAAHPAVRAAASGTEHFQLMSTSATSTKNPIIATGVFTAGGVDHSGSKSDRVVFPGGTFKIRHSKGHGTQSFDPKSCLSTIRIHGTYKLGHGTGKYAGISGHGRYQLRILAVGAHKANGQCKHAAPKVFEQIIMAHGPVRL